MEQPIKQENDRTGTPPDEKRTPERSRRNPLPYLVLLLVLYLSAVALIYLPSLCLLQHEDIRIAGPAEKPCPGTLWTPSGEPRAVLVAGHGITANRGIMAMIACAFAYNGYAVLALDFRGHGSSRETFDWQANPAQVQAWCGWAREHFPGLPLAYLGYSMGGFAGAEAFRNNPSVDAFVALGALPRHRLQCPTLVAAGAQEELFSPEQAKKAVDGWGDYVSSPFSDHVLEAHDPILIGRILAWVNRTLDITPLVRSPWRDLLKVSGDKESAPRPPVAFAFPWHYWSLFVIALITGSLAAVMLADRLVGLTRPPVAPSTPPPALIRTWSVNPYRVIGGVFGCHGPGMPPRTGNVWSALIRGSVFSLLLVLFLTGLLNRHVFTCAPSHPERLLTWLVLLPLLTVPVFFDARILERLPFHRPRIRFAVAASTRAAPFLVLGATMRALGPPAAFPGMILILFAFIFVLLSLVHTLATRVSADWRAGAAASTVFFAWLIAFWLPLFWPWVGVISAR